MSERDTKKVMKDPICGMSVNEDFAVNAEHGGKKFFFCGNSCRQRFMADPTGEKRKKEAKTSKK